MKNKADTNRIAYIKQRNYCASLLPETKKDHNTNLNEKDVADNKQFWRTVKPFLSDKVKSSEKITLVEGEEIINKDGKNAEILNTFFSSAVKNLKIPEYQETECLTNNTSKPIFKVILKYRRHPSIVVIKKLNKGSKDLISVELVLKMLLKK